MELITAGLSNLINLIQSNPTGYLLIFGLAIVVTIAALIIKREPLITMMLFTWLLAAVPVVASFIAAARQTS